MKIEIRPSVVCDDPIERDAVRSVVAQALRYYDCFRVDVSFADASTEPDGRAIWCRIDIDGDRPAGVSVQAYGGSLSEAIHEACAKAERRIHSAHGRGTPERSGGKEAA